MLLKIVLVILIILLGLIIVLPFVLNLIGFRVLELGSVSGGGAIGAGAATLLRSSDGGENWESVSISENRNTPFPAQVLDLVFHPANPNILFLGGYRAGLWKSENGGTLWNRIEGGDGVLRKEADVYAIEISRSNPNIMYLAVSQNRRGRVLKSENGGQTFQEIYFIPTDGYDVLDLLLDQNDSNHVFIGTGQGGILETRNGGRTWRVVRWFTQPVTLFVSNPDAVREMYVRIGPEQLFKTVDGGDNWTDLGQAVRKVSESSSQQAPQGLFNPFQGFRSPSIEAFVVDPRNPAFLYLGSPEGLLRSLDGGFVWDKLEVLIPSDALPVRAIALHPHASQTVFVGASSDLHRSQDAGISWNIKTLPTTAKIKKILIHPLQPQMIFVVLD